MMKGSVPAEERDQVRREMIAFGQLIVEVDYEICMKRKSALSVVLRKACKQLK